MKCMTFRDVSQKKYSRVDVKKIKNVKIVQDLIVFKRVLLVNK